MAYATRAYRAPVPDFPMVNVQANPAAPPGREGIILPVEDGRWIVTLSGTRGGEPTGDPEAFTDFALGLGDPVIGELIRDAEPLTGVVTNRSTAHRRRCFEKLRHWPDGFTVIGDAVAGCNPVYGHGITVARRAHSPCAPTRPGRASSGRAVPAAWDLAIGQDIRSDASVTGCGRAGPGR
ncbi:hypothetical protein ACFWN1_03240 [Streptomyces sp. NPDC058459]|uniref:hypothetical protein n=1 Tax=Streptomyces sp. NPDC058459 TaxID=3346508 RepID=UPI003665D469